MTFIFGSAAVLIFNKLFFPAFDPVAGTIASLATFSVGFDARPLDGIVFGHFGDRIGRKAMLVMSLTMMGGVTFLVGLFRTYASVGAPPRRSCRPCCVSCTVLRSTGNGAAQR
ncbi:hypothetical protein [Caballeronia sp. DA-9]|uniref:hypothetical protein n=1 Tax=Caballeronia sp. DA-9 TaxID=3436237 RepID=UPI003F66CEBD